MSWGWPQKEPRVHTKWPSLSRRYYQSIHQLLLSLLLLSSFLFLCWRITSVMCIVGEWVERKSIGSGCAVTIWEREAERKNWMRYGWVCINKQPIRQFRERETMILFGLALHPSLYFIILFLCVCFFFFRTCVCLRPLAGLMRPFKNAFHHRHPYSS